MDRTWLDGRWKTIAERHAASVDAFLAAARDVEPARWHEPIGDGKWTPAQVTQHVTQTYEVLLRQVRTGEGLRIQTGRLLRQVLRVAVLRPIMWTRKIPSGARAPRDLRPRDEHRGQDDAIARLREAVDEFESELFARSRETRVQLTHHLFGSVDAVDGLDFVAVHTEHHCRQLASRAMAAKRGA